jgi:hypothetical protein
MVDRPYRLIYRMDAFLVRFGILLVTVYVLLYKTVYKKIVFVVLNLLSSVM